MVLTTDCVPGVTRHQAAHHVVLEGGTGGPGLGGLPVLLDGVLHLGLPQGDGAARQAGGWQQTRGQAGQQPGVVTSKRGQDSVHH